jgi:hypothetical protein
LGGSKKKTRAANAEDWDQPEDQRAVSDEWGDLLRLEAKPLLIAKDVKRENHRRANQAVIQIAAKHTASRKIENKRVHDVVPLRIYFTIAEWPRDCLPPEPTPKGRTQSDCNGPADALAGPGEAWQLTDSLISLCFTDVHQS